MKLICDGHVEVSGVYSGSQTYCDGLQNEKHKCEHEIGIGI